MKLGLGLGLDYQRQGVDSFTYPSAPLNLLATSIGGGEYDLTWDEPASEGASPIIEYNVYQNGVMLDTVAAPATNLDGVPAAEGDTFYVRAANTEGEGSASNIETIPDPDPGLNVGIWGNIFGGIWGGIYGRSA